MATVAESRLATLLPWLTKFPLLLLTEEQIGAFLLGLVPPFDEFLLRDERDRAKSEARKHIKTALESGRVFRLGFVGTYRHGVRARSQRTLVESNDRSSRETRTIEDILCPTFGIDWGKAIGGVGTSRHQKDGMSSADQFVTSQDQRTWVYAGAAVGTVPFFKDRYIPQPVMAGSPNTFATHLLDHQLRNGASWLKTCSELERVRLEGQYDLDLNTLKEFGPAGDELINLARVAEVNWPVHQAIQVWCPCFKTNHGIGTAENSVWEDSRVFRHFGTEHKSYASIVKHAMEVNGVMTRYFKHGW